MLVSQLRGESNENLFCQFKGDLPGGMNKFKTTPRYFSPESKVTQDILASGLQICSVSNCCMLSDQDPGLFRLQRMPWWLDTSRRDRQAAWRLTSGLHPKVRIAL